MPCCLGAPLHPAPDHRLQRRGRNTAFQMAGAYRNVGGKEMGFRCDGFRACGENLVNLDASISTRRLRRVEIDAS